jgi:outer membrane protein
LSRSAAAGLLSLCFFTATAATFAQQSDEPPLTVQAAEKLALEFNPETRAAFSQQKLIAAQLAEERARQLPKVQFVENYGYSNNPVYVFSSLLMQQRFKEKDFQLNNLNRPSPLTNFQSSVFVSMPIFAQLQTSTAIAGKKLAQSKASREQELVQQKVRLELLRAYFGVLVAQSNRDVAKEAVIMAKAELKRVGDLRSVGSVAYSDELAIEVQLSEFQQQLAQTEGATTVSYAALNKVLGLPGFQPRRLQGRLSKKNFSLPAQDECIRQALAKRADYAEAQLSVRQSQEEMRAASGRLLPKVDFVASYIHAGNAVVNGGNNLGLGVNVSFDLFDWQKPAQIRQARAAREVAEARIQQKSNEIAFEVVQAYQNFEVARQKREVATRTVKHAEETLRIVRDRYQVGLTQVTELLRAETTYIRARTGLLSAYYDCYTGYAEVLHAMGNLHDLSSFEG